MKILFTFSLLLFLVFSAQSQKNISRGNQQWTQYYNSIKISDKLSVNSDVGFRMRNELGEVSQTLMRSGLGFQPNKQSKFIVGFAFLTFHKNGQSTKVEYRPYQEVSLSQPFNKMRLQHRFRSEQRKFSSTDESGISSGFNHRFRYRFMINVPISNMGKSERLLSLNFGDEIFINAGKEIEYNMFDGNRVLIGPAIQVNTALNISLIYNYQFGQKNAPESFSSTQVLWVGIKHKINVHD